MDSIQKADLEDAERMLEREFTANGTRQKITKVYFSDYACEVCIEVRVWTAPNCSHLEILNLAELKALMGQS